MPVLLILIMLTTHMPPQQAWTNYLPILMAAQLYQRRYLAKLVTIHAWQWPYRASARLETDAQAIKPFYLF